MDAAHTNALGQTDGSCDDDPATPGENDVIAPTTRDIALVQDLYELSPPGAPTTIFSAGPDIAVRFRDDNAAEEGYGTTVERWDGSGWVLSDFKYLTNTIAPCSAVPCGQNRTVYYRKPDALPGGSYRLCLYAASDLYPIVTTVCAASRTLSSNLAFDTDRDGFSDRNEAGTPLCQDNGHADPLDDNLVDDGCPAYGGLREVDTQCTNTTSDDSAADDLIVNDGCPTVGAYPEASFKIGTDPLSTCSASPTHDAWPADFNKDQVISFGDIGQLTAVFGQSIPAVSSRRNIAPEQQLDLFITFADIGRLTTVFGFGCEDLPALSPLIAASGTYVGDGSSSRYIDVGFQPDMVVIKSNANEQAVFRTSNMPAGESFVFICSPKLLTGILSLDSGGFTVGSDDKVNRGGAGAPTYHWFAIKDSQPGANMKLGSYTGNGQTSHPITGVGFRPAWAFVKADAGGNFFCGVQRQTDMPANQSFGFAGASVSEPYSDGILSLDNDGFTVGSRSDVNGQNWKFYYVAFKGSPQFATGHYTGTGTGGLTVSTGISPAFVSVKGDSDAGGSRARWRALGLGFPDTNSAAYAINSPDSQDGIQTLQAGGFIVGADDDVNAGGITYYWVALEAQMP